MNTQQQEYLTFDQEVTDLWKTQRDGMERVLTSMREGTLDGTVTVDLLHHRRCGCAYGHIGDLDLEQAKKIRIPYRKQSGDYYTPLEDAVEKYKPGHTIENNDSLQALYDQLIAIRDTVYVGS